MKAKRIELETVESFDEKDRAAIHDIVANLKQSYLDRKHDALLEFYRAQRQVNRASHEITRLEKHLERIDSFIEKNNIPLGEV